MIVAFRVSLSAPKIGTRQFALLRIADKGYIKVKRGRVAMPFWITAIGLTLITGLFLALALVRGRKGDVSPAAYDLQVYRDQLAEVDRDLARGVVSEEDADRVRTEVSRRILAADAQLQRETQEKQGSNRNATAGIVLCVLVIAAGSFGVYQWIGTPGYPDLALVDRFAMAQNALDERISQADFEAQLPPRTAPDIDPDFAALLEELRTKVGERPNDLEGHEFLVRNEATVQNFKAAYVAQERVIELKGDAAAASDFVRLADLMIRAANGYVSPEADLILREALARDPGNGFALYYSGLMLSQNGRPDMTFRIWRRLLEAGPDQAPWIPPIRARIEDLAWIAGQPDYRVPDLRGPSAEDIEAAEDMSAEDRMTMIRGMVAGLADRLATEGGSADEWARLISAYGVLQETEKAQAIWSEAQTVFAEAPEALSIITEAARAVGLQ